MKQAMGMVAGVGMKIGRGGLAVMDGLPSFVDITFPHDNLLFNRLVRGYQFLGMFSQIVLQNRSSL